jgi:hypothetical protein
MVAAASRRRNTATEERRHRLGLAVAGGDLGLLGTARRSHGVDKEAVRRPAPGQHQSIGEIVQPLPSEPGHGRPAALTVRQARSKRGTRLWR